MQTEKDVIAVITGSSKGIGKGIAKELGRQGAIVYVTGRDQESVEKVVSEITHAGGQGVAVVCDMSDDAQIARLFKQVEQKHGYLNILVNNATTLNSQMGVKPLGSHHPSCRYTGCWLTFSSCCDLACGALVACRWARVNRQRIFLCRCEGA